ncbi:hypothetical protein OUZ56_028482 [Daphnia magna]|uniref:Uncharacterized protein n=1 Tax=Daphnia magna TaxID=35525 RepID=A0ABR0B436_9CRUS|nr:hypothetical protein OUZ56_028482 [Daphnia magna]
MRCTNRLSFDFQSVPSGVVDSVVGGNHHLVSEIEDLVREKMVRRGITSAMSRLIWYKRDERKERSIHPVDGCRSEQKSLKNLMGFRRSAFVFVWPMSGIGKNQHRDAPFHPVRPAPSIHHPLGILNCAQDLRVLF